jgi:hypothetical protein
MITGTWIAVALLLGYSVTVACALAVTFGLTSSSPAFVIKAHHMTVSYKRLQIVTWLVCVTLGAFVTCAVAQGTQPFITASSLAAIFIAMLWMNTWEARQRGLGHQLLMSVTSVAGVIAGYELAGRYLKFS